MAPITESNFTKNIIAINQLNVFGFKTWLFKQGMKFAEPEQWWDHTSLRPTPHEGLDIITFLDSANDEQQLNKNTIVPPLYMGKVVSIIDDFLGQTVIINHGIVNGEGSILHGFYAHLSPKAKIITGAIISQTEGLGTITTKSSSCPPHLHISTVWISKDFPIEKFRWPDFTAQPGFQPCDPLFFSSPAPTDKS